MSHTYPKTIAYTVVPTSLNLLVNEIRIDRRFHPSIAGDGKYRYAIPQRIDIPIGASTGIVQGVRDVWRGILHRLLCVASCFQYLFFPRSFMC